jgi:hypothetical protein
MSNKGSGKNEEGRMKGASQFGMLPYRYLPKSDFPSISHSTRLLIFTANFPHFGGMRGIKPMDFGLLDIS